MEDRLNIRDVFLGIPSFDSRYQFYHKGDVIIQEGMIGHDMFVILKGEVDVLVYTKDGKEVLLATLKEPEMFGEIALFDGQPRTATVVARTDCEILRLNREEFIELIRQDPSTLFKLVKILIKRLRQADEKIKVLSMDSAVERLRWFIQKTVAEHRSPEVLLPPHSEIGKTLSLTREAVTRALNTLKKEGVISNTSGRVRINIRKL